MNSVLVMCNVQKILFSFASTQNASIIWYVKNTATAYRYQYQYQAQEDVSGI
jgi:hypothetical protein